MKLSVCLIVKNEEEVLERCLTCAKKFADEIVVVDTGSKDRTKEIANKFADKVCDFKWIDDFAAARNFAFEKASSDMLMWLDADDVVLDEDAEKICKLKTIENPADLYMCDYVLSHEEDMTPIFSYKRERIFLKSKGYRWVDRVHEVIVPSGRVENADIRVYHKKEKAAPSGRNLRIYRKMKREHQGFSPRQQFYYARELMFNSHIKEAVREFNKFLTLPNAWVENKIQACIDLSSCYSQLGENERARLSLFKSFEYSSPRSEVTCRLGNLFLKENKYNEAAYWFKQSIAQAGSVGEGAFVEKELHDFIPALQLCYVYSLMGDYENSYKYHLISRSLRPNDKAVLHNQEFFSKHFENLAK